ncbi:MAG: hypothetical protein ABL982_04260 [Vicinamibacterales bacterium]
MRDDIPRSRVLSGLNYLADSQRADGSFEVVVITGGPGFPSGAVSSPFVTGLVLDALQRLGPAYDVGRVIERAAAWLLAEMEEGPSWRFYRCEPPLRLDLDSTSVVLRALRHAGVGLDYRAAAQRLDGCRTVSGRFRTWVEQRATLRERMRTGPRGLLRPRFNPVDPVVNANVVAFRQEVGRPSPGAERFVRAWARSRNAFGASPYYLHPECFAYALAKVAGYRAGGDALRTEAEAFVTSLLGRPRARTSEPAFLLGRRLAAALRLGLAVPDLDRAMETLSACQRADGSWPSGAVWTAVRWAPGAPRPLLGSPALETAIALEVLARCPPQ